jgi:hypothetical protein
MKRLILLIFCALGLAFTFAVREASAQVTTPSSTTWTCAGGETDFTPSFNFVTYSHVTVKEDSVVQVLGTDYTWFDADTIRLVVACSAGEVIAMVRDSDPSNPVVTFTSGSRLTANLLNDALLQNIYAMEEIEENTLVQGMAKSGGHWDAASLRIQNCSDALSAGDVACFGQLTIANADKYPGTTTDNKLLKGDGSAYVESETLPDSVAGDATKVLQVASAGVFAYGPKFPALTGDAEKLVSVNASEDGFDYGPTLADIAGGDAEKVVTVNAGETGFDFTSVTALGAATGAWDAGNTRGTILLDEADIRVNYGTAAVSNGTALTVHTAWSAAPYTCSCTWQHTGPWHGNERPGIGCGTLSTTQVTFNIDTGNNGRTAAYICIGAQ